MKFISISGVWLGGEWYLFEVLVIPSFCSQSFVFFFILFFSLFYPTWGCCSEVGFTDCIRWVICVWLLDVGRSLEEKEGSDNYSLHSSPAPGVSGVVVFLCGRSDIFPCPCLFRPGGGNGFPLLLGPGRLQHLLSVPSALPSLLYLVSSSTSVWLNSFQYAVCFLPGLD